MTSRKQSSTLVFARERKNQVFQMEVIDQKRHQKPGPNPKFFNRQGHPALALGTRNAKGNELSGEYEPYS